MPYQFGGMATDDLFGSRDIPLHLAEYIFYLAGSDALTSVRCANKANAEAYRSVALSLAKRGQWRCRVDSPELLQFAVEHRLRCLHVVSCNINSLRQLASLDRLRELCIENGGEGLDPADLEALEYLPMLVGLELKYLGLLALPLLHAPDATLKRLVWCEVAGDDASEPIRRMTGPLPGSLVHLQCRVESYLALPDLPPLLEHLDLDTSRPPTGAIPALPATLRHLSLSESSLARLPDDLPSQLTRLDCSSNELATLPPLPDALEKLDCNLNRLRTPLPDLPGSLVCLDCSSNRLTAMPALPATLTRLDCIGNHLASLPPLPASLEVLHCSYNRLATLPAPLPPNLSILTCGGNDLRHLPALPRTLKVLRCGGARARHGGAARNARHGSGVSLLSRQWARIAPGRRADIAACLRMLRE